MNGLEELIEYHDLGCQWLAVDGEKWVAKVFETKPYLNNGKWDSDEPQWIITPKNGETLELEREKGFREPIPIGEAIDILQKYHQRIDMLKQSDMVNHPAHYTSGNIEVWDFIIDQDLNYCLGSAVKYISRAGKKDDAIQDLNKAINFLKREIKRLETGE